MNHTATPEFSSAPFPGKAFMITLLINAVWINISEIFRYFAFVMPMMREAFSIVPGIAPMNVPVFLSWGVWMTVLLVTLTVFVWLYLERFGYNVRNSVVSASIFWAATFIILWLGLYNMNLATLEIMIVALPLAWLELAIAALIVNWAMPKFSQN
ncbi:MAG: hypothetical protein AAF423_11840 [Pseudomonadota bacterium]